MLNLEKDIFVNKISISVKYSLERYVFVWLFIIYSLGLYFAKLHPDMIVLSSIYIVFLALLCVLFKITLKNGRKTLCYILFTAALPVIAFLRLDSMEKKDIIKYPIIGEITSHYETRSRSRYTLSNDDGNYYIYASKEDRKIEIGSVARIDSRLHPFIEKGFPTLFDYDLYKWVRNLKGIIYLPKKAVSEKVIKKPGKYRHFINSLRDELKSRINTNFAASEAGFLSGILLGDKQGISRQKMEEVSKIGLAHVLVVSGLHLTIWVAVLYFMIKFMPIPKPFKILFVLSGCWILSEICGPNLPVVRAFIMTFFFLVSMLVQRRKYNVNILACSGLIIELLYPRAMWDISFQLSFIATLGILIWVPFIHNKVRQIESLGSHRILSFIIDAMSVSVFAQLALSPLLLETFGYISLISPLVNLFEVPLVNLLTVLGYVFLAFAKIPLLGNSLVFILSKMLWLWEKTILFWLKLSNIAYHKSQFDPLVFSVLFALILIAFLWRMNYLKKWVCTAIILIFLSSGFIMYWGAKKDLPEKELWLFSYNNELGYIMHNDSKTYLLTPTSRYSYQLKSFLKLKGWRQVLADRTSFLLVEGEMEGIEIKESMSIVDSISMGKTVFMINRYPDARKTGFNYIIISANEPYRGYQERECHVTYADRKPSKKNTIALKEAGATGFLIYKDRILLQNGGKKSLFAEGDRLYY
ncbi:MAG: ComEC/Rec2 family competence protein [Candidatus Coatesbacteria bacterium]|nr:ComEC/Rec2 family competence protein [Candidatus Coatesbacteria bacterium]